MSMDGALTGMFITTTELYGTGTNTQWGTTIDPDLQETSITGFTTVEHSQMKVRALFSLLLTAQVQIRL